MSSVVWKYKKKHTVFLNIKRFRAKKIYKILLYGRYVYGNPTKMFSIAKIVKYLMWQPFKNILNNIIKKDRERINSQEWF